MNKPKYFLLICLIGISALANSQKIAWNTEQKNVSDWPIHDIIGYDANGYYITRYKNSNPHVVNATYANWVTLEKYDYTGHRLFSKELSVGEGKDKYNFDGIFYMKDAIMVVMYAPDVKTAYAVKVNPDGTVDNNKILIGAIDNKWKRDIMADDRYAFALSADKTTLLAYYHKEKENKISISAVGDTPNILWTKDIPTSFPDGKYDVEQAAVTANTAYVLVSTTKEKNKKDYTLFVYNHSTDAIKQIDVNVGSGNHVADLDIVADNYDNAILAGIYSTEFTKNIRGTTSTWSVPQNDAAGTFLFTVDNTGKVLVNNSIPFTKDFLLKFINEKNVAKGEGIAPLSVNKIIVNDDKSIIIAAEQSNSMKYNAWNAQFLQHRDGPGAITEYYEYSDAIVAKLNADGSLAWIKDLPKKQQMTSHSVAVPFVCSYGISVTGNTVTVVYNDHKKNDGLKQEDIEKDRDVLKPSIIDGGPDYIALIMESLDYSSGDTKRNTLYNGEKQKTKLTFYSTLILPTEPGKFAVYRSDDKTDQFGQLVVQ